MASSLALRRAAAPTTTTTTASSLLRKFLNPTTLSTLPHHHRFILPPPPPLPLSTTRFFTTTTTTTSSDNNDSDSVADSDSPGLVKLTQLVMREDNEALYFRIDMPGVGKDKKKICEEQGILIITGEAEKVFEDDEPRRYSSRIDLSTNLYNIYAVKAELKNGVLKIRIPKVKW